jgi:Helix-turn-helix
MNSALNALREEVTYETSTDAMAINTGKLADIHGTCERLRELRESKELSQADIEKRTARVENGHTVPAVETLEKMARALEVPMYQLMMASPRFSE